MGEKQTAKRYYVSGIVQGVGYRNFAQRAARGLGIVGYTRNLHDGRVEIYAAGDAESLVTLRRELERGPSAAQVASLVEEDAELDSEFAHGFSIE